MLDNLYKNFALPFVITVIGVFAVFSQSTVLFDYSSLIEVFPYGLLLIVILVSAFLLQFESFYQSLVVFFLYLTIQLNMQVSMDVGETYLGFIGVNLYWPWLILLLHSVREQSLKSIPAIIAMAATALIIAVPMLTAYGFEQEQFLSRVPAGLLVLVKQNTVFPVGLLVSYFGAFVFMFVLYVLWPSQGKANWLIMLGLFTLLFVNLRLPLISALICSTLALILLSSLVRDAFHLAFIDELTKIPSRKALQKQLNSLGRTYSLAMLDVDHFKKFNDTYGHDVGDQVLMLVAAQIDAVSDGGKAYRYGGEEFTIVFPGKSPEEVVGALEMVRKNIENYQIAIRAQDRPKNNEEGKQKRGAQKSNTVSVTISIGVAPRTGKLLPADVLNEADKALYMAKKAGRNCVKTV